MARQKYHGYIIDRDDLGRLYIYCMSSPYSEDSDRNYNCGNSIKEAKETINSILSSKPETKVKPAMEFDLHTYDIQDILIALIECDWKPYKDVEERLKKAKSIFTDRLCNIDNDFTLHFTVASKARTTNHDS